MVWNVRVAFDDGGRVIKVHHRSRFDS
jgi:hypothetical protein